MISIIIPTCNRNVLLKECLSNLKPSTQFPASMSYEVIVTDDSKENTARCLIEEHFTWVKWMSGPKKGPAANRNYGANEANGEWLLFIDDDCLPCNHIINEYCNAINDRKDVFVFEGCIKADRPQASFNEESPVNEIGGYLWSCNVMIQKKTFCEKLKGFDDNFPYAAMEDVDLYYRINKAGLRHTFLSQAYVIHPWRMQKKPYSTTMKRFKSTLYYLRKYPEKASEINSLYYLKAFYTGFLKDVLNNLFKYRFNGLFSKIIIGSLNLCFSFYLLFYKTRKNAKFKE